MRISFNDDNFSNVAADTLISLKMFHAERRQLKHVHACYVTKKRKLQRNHPIN